MLIKFQVGYAARFTLIAVSAATLFLLNVAVTEAAFLYLAPASGTFSVSRNFTVNVMVNSADQAMNAAEGVLNFPTDKLQVVGVSKAGSIFNLWVQEPSFSNSGNSGNVRFEGVVLNPGYNGAAGKILEITFRAREAGTANAVFASGSVLANDGQGTNILSALSGGTYTLQVAAQTPQLTAPGSLPSRPSLKHFIKTPDGELVQFHTSENGVKWSNSSFAKLVWTLSAEVSGIVTNFNESPDYNPGTKPEGLFDNKTFNFLEEGKHYFHIRYINSVGAGPILHYPLFIDLTAPNAFGIQFFNGESAEYTTSNPSPLIKFFTSDSLSGLDHYEVRIDQGDWVNANTLLFDGSYRLPKLKPGSHALVVRAYDKAGNYTDAITSITVEAIIGPEITYYSRHLVSPGENLIVRGNALPNAKIELFMRKRKNGDPLIISGVVDSRGQWEIIYDNIIPSGTYALTAKQVLDNGAESLETDPVYVRVNSLFWRLWQWFKNLFGFTILALVFIAIALVLAYYFWHRFRIWQMRLHREAKEVKDALERGVKQVRKELAGGEPRGKIAKDLEAVKREVEEELKDIDKTLK